MPLSLAVLDTLPTAVDFYAHYWNKRPFLASGAIEDAVMAGLITTGAGQALRGLLVQREGATFTTRNGYLTPVVASVLGLSFLGESLTMAHGISYAAVAVGLFISAQR